MWKVRKKSCCMLLHALLRSTDETDEILKFTFLTGIFFVMHSWSAPENLRYISILNFSPTDFFVHILYFTPRVDWFGNFCWALYFPFVINGIFCEWRVSISEKPKGLHYYLHKYGFQTQWIQLYAKLRIPHIMLYYYAKFYTGLLCLYETYRFIYFYRLKKYTLLQCLHTDVLVFVAWVFLTVFVIICDQVYKVFF